MRRNRPDFGCPLLRAGFRPAIAAAAIISATLPNYWSPGSTDNILVAQLAGIPVMEQINHISFNILILFGLCIVTLTVLCFVFGDYKKGGFQQSINEKGLNRPLPELPQNPNLLKCFCPAPSGRPSLCHLPLVPES